MSDFKFIPDYIQRMLDREFFVDRPPPDLEFILEKVESDNREIGLASRGELLMIYGPPKSRKSTILNCIVASAYTDNENNTLGFKLSLNEDDQIFYFDTEMPTTAFYRRQMKLNKMCGFGGEGAIPGYRAFSLKPFSHGEIIDQVEHCVENMTKGGVILFDQMADLVGNINDRDQVNELISKLEYWSELSNSIIIGTIHVTRTTDMMTGVLGSELSKKMDTGFYLEKQKGSKFTKVTHLLAREDDVDDFSFEHNIYGYPQLVRDLEDI